MARTTETTGHAGAMKRFFALAVAVMAFTASARTVYDAGKALRQNCESGSYANPYTDTNGGVWSYLAASSLSHDEGTLPWAAYCPSRVMIAYLTKVPPISSTR